jgi:hypothetical protein
LSPWPQGALAVLTDSTRLAASVDGVIRSRQTTRVFRPDAVPQPNSSKSSRRHAQCPELSTPSRGICMCSWARQSKHLAKPSFKRIPRTANRHTPRSQTPGRQAVLLGKKTLDITWTCQGNPWKRSQSGTVLTNREPAQTHNDTHLECRAKA